jgi:uncharacterized membrane protein
LKQSCLQKYFLILIHKMKIMIELCNIQFIETFLWVLIIQRLNYETRLWLRLSTNSLYGISSRYPIKKPIVYPLFFYCWQNKSKTSVVVFISFNLRRFLRCNICI